MHDFKSILEEDRNEQLVQEQEKEKRSCNFIIHGLEEKGENAEENDAVMVELFLQKINADVKPAKFYRLGKSTSNKNRPLKVEMGSNFERDAVMYNLKHLKGTEEELGKLSIKEDLTRSEREQVKKFVNIAKERNASDTSHHWVVRGSPKNGLRLLKLAKK